MPSFPLLCTKNGTLELVGVVGSRAYGLTTPESDTDLLGVFTAPIADLLAGVGHDLTVVSEKKDRVEGCSHELTKFVALLAQGNPTVTELVWLPKFVVQSPVGEILVENREAFMSLRYVSACVGYAEQQLQKVINRTDPLKRSKHARHLMRLMIQAEQYLQTGELTVGLTPEQVLIVRGAELLTVDELQRVAGSFQQKVSALKQKSFLPLTPDKVEVRAVLDECRSEQRSREQVCSVTHVDDSEDITDLTGEPFRSVLESHARLLTGR